MIVTDKKKKLEVLPKEQKLSSPELNRFLGSLVELWGQMLEFENCGVFLWGEDYQTMTPLTWVHPCEDYLKKFKGEWIKQIADQLLVERKIFILRDLSDSQKSLILAPFKSGQEDGVFVIWCGKPKESFTAKELEMVSSLAEQLNLYAESLHLQEGMDHLSEWLEY